MFTLEELWNKTYEQHRMTFDNKGNFKEGTGIISNTKVKKCEDVLKQYIRKNRKRDLVVNVVWNKKTNDIGYIKVIR